MTDMTVGRPAPHILRFTLPLLVGNALQQAYNLVDSIVVGNVVGKEALAAVGSTFILTFLLTSLFAGIGLGFTIVVARFYGSGERNRVRSTVSTAYLTGLAGAVPVTLLGYFLARPLLLALNTPAGLTLAMADDYLKVIFLGTVWSFGYNVNAGVLQGLGDSVSSLVFLAVATVLNIVLDLVFVAGLGWGVRGAAIATVLSQSVSFVLGLAYIAGKLKLVSFRARDFRLDLPIFREAARIGLPNGVQNMLFCLGTMAIQRLINGYGPAFMAGWSGAGKIDSVAFLPVASFASAATTFTGQNAGAGRLDRVRAGLRATLAMSTLVCLAVSAFAAWNAGFLVSLFSRDPTVVRAGVDMLIRLMPCYVLLSFLFVINSVVRGAGESFWPFLASMTSFLFTRLPAAYLLDHFFGPRAIGWCYGIGWVFGLLMIVPYYFSGRWTRHVRQNSKN